MRKILELISFLLRIHNDKIKQSWSYIFIIIEETSNYKQLLDLNFKVCQIISENNISLLNITNKKKLLYAYYKIASQSENLNYILQILGMLNDLKVHFTISDKNENIGHDDDDINYISNFIDENPLDNTIISSRNNSNVIFSIHNTLNNTDPDNVLTNSICLKNNTIHSNHIINNIYSNQPSNILNDIKNSESIHTQLNYTLWIDFVKTIQKIIGNGFLNGWNDIYETGTRIIVDYILLHTKIPKIFLEIIYCTILPSFLMQIQQKLVFTNITDRKFTFINIPPLFSSSVYGSKGSLNSLYHIKEIITENSSLKNENTDNIINTTVTAKDENDCHINSELLPNTKIDNFNLNKEYNDNSVNHSICRLNCDFENVNISNLSENEISNTLRMLDYENESSTDIYEYTLRNKETYIHVIHKINTFLKNTNIKENENNLAYSRFILYFQNFIKYFCTMEIDSSQRGSTKWKDEISLLLIDALESTITNNFQQIYFDLTKNIILLQNNILYFKEEIYVKLVKYGIEKNVNQRDYYFYDLFTRFLLVNNYKIRDSIFDLIKNDINNDIFLIYIKWMGCLDNKCIKIILEQIESKLFSENFNIHNVSDVFFSSESVNDIDLRCKNIGDLCDHQIKNKFDDSNIESKEENENSKSSECSKSKSSPSRINITKTEESTRKSSNTKNILNNSNHKINKNVEKYENGSNNIDIQPLTFKTETSFDFTKDEKLDSMPDEIFNVTSKSTFGKSEDNSDNEKETNTAETYTSNSKHTLTNNKLLYLTEKQGEAKCIDPGNKFKDILSRFNSDCNSAKSRNKTYTASNGNRYDKSPINGSDTASYFSKSNENSQENTDTDQTSDFDQHTSKSAFNKLEKDITKNVNSKKDNLFNDIIQETTKKFFTSSDTIKESIDCLINENKNVQYNNNDSNSTEQNNSHKIDIINTNKNHTKPSHTNQSDFDRKNKKSLTLFDNVSCGTPNEITDVFLLEKTNLVINGHPFNKKNTYTHQNPAEATSPHIKISHCDKVSTLTIEKLMKTLNLLKENEDFWENIIQCFKGISIIIRNCYKLVDIYLECIQLIFENELRESDSDDLVTFFGSIAFDNKIDESNTLSLNSLQKNIPTEKTNESNKESIDASLKNDNYSKESFFERKNSNTNTKTGLYSLNNASKICNISSKSQLLERNGENNSVDSFHYSRNSDSTNKGYLQRRKEKLLIELIEYFTSTIDFHINNTCNKIRSTNYNNSCGENIVLQNQACENIYHPYQKSYNIIENLKVDSKLLKKDELTKNSDIFSFSDKIQVNLERKNEKQSLIFNREFINQAFNLIEKLSIVKINSYRENLSMFCIKILFNHSKYIPNMLINRIKNTLENYVKQESVYKDLYPRVKRKEVYLIIDSVIRKPTLIKQIKSELIECLSVKDFNVIEKIKNCLKIDM
ncbi:hypothetical protein EDEG_00147 [Edhazardia aedis USNM 41457]|uniref:Uncharacterized protein n=1 Tax=Edhazardia aedis (strain USNM 41457) TaxID=1003232 RepID=J9D8Z1_EDHAE|nr:hypothetical protein EDEG_00147 [Edhazardia aedis USNM 41457]|eukprot:EJW04231.1 hypothetical protein EDEG_00147 [Edhazardia aedis USNM 41457]